APTIPNTEVRQHDVELIEPQATECIFTRSDGNDPMGLRLQDECHQLADGRVVVDDKHTQPALIFGEARHNESNASACPGSDSSRARTVSMSNGLGMQPFAPIARARS